MSVIVLGVDPGVARMGVGVVRVNDNNTFSSLYYGCITTHSKMLFNERLLILYNGLKNVILSHNPSCVGVEELFFSKNAKTALQVAHARGVILLIAAQLNLPVYEFKPLDVKQSLTGYGAADKKQVQTMVRLLLNLSEIPQPDDAADALAIAWCCASSHKILQIEKNL